jgi:hypothetical protein
VVLVVAGVLLMIDNFVHMKISWYCFYEALVLSVFAFSAKCRMNSGKHDTVHPVIVKGIIKFLM